MFEQCFEFPGAGFDDGAQSEVVRREPREQGFVEIVKRGEFDRTCQASMGPKFAKQRDDATRLRNAAKAAVEEEAKTTHAR